MHIFISIVWKIVWSFMQIICLFNMFVLFVCFLLKTFCTAYTLVGNREFQMLQQLSVCAYWLLRFRKLPAWSIARSYQRIAESLDNTFVLVKSAKFRREETYSICFVPTNRLQAKLSMHEIKVWKYQSRKPVETGLTLKWSVL